MRQVDVVSKFSVVVVAALAVTGCEQLGIGMDKEPLPSAENIPPPGDPVLAGGPIPGDGEVFNDPVVPAPADWDGAGVLEKDKAEAVNAPGWTQIEAEVVEREGIRYLLGTGVAQGIDNPSLAQHTAENRARHVLAHYLDKKRLVDSRIAGTWQDPATGAFYARAEIEVPEGFMPKHPLPKKPN